MISKLVEEVNSDIFLHISTVNRLFLNITGSFNPIQMKNNFIVTLISLTLMIRNSYKFSSVIDFIRFVFLANKGYPSDVLEKFNN